MTRLGRLLVLIAATGFPLAAQQPPSAAFEVVSVKPRTSDDGRWTLTMQPGEPADSGLIGDLVAV